MSLAANVKSKMLAKRDPEMERAALDWITALTGDEFPPGVDYTKALRSGHSLCKLINVLAPGSVTKIHTSGPDFKLMENVNSFTKAAKAFGIADNDVFQTVDLWEGKDVSNVTATLYALGRAVHKHPEFKGPFLVPKPNE